VDYGEIGVRGKFNGVGAARMRGVFCKTMDCGLIYPLWRMKTQNDHDVRIAVLLVEMIEQYHIHTHIFDGAKDTIRLGDVHRSRRSFPEAVLDVHQSTSPWFGWGTMYTQLLKRELQKRFP
jgi:hypothetical protein